MKKRIAAVLLSLLTVALILAGCSGSDSGTDQSGEGGNSTAEANAAENAAADPGQEQNEAEPAEPTASDLIKAGTRTPISEDMSIR